VASLEGPDRDFFLEHWGGGSELSAGTVERLTEIVKTSGARAYTEKLIESLCAEAEALLKQLTLPAEVDTALRELAHLATARSE
jgi:geranylgeranyl pyrophosphate synthase